MGTKHRFQPMIPVQNTSQVRGTRVRFSILAVLCLIPTAEISAQDRALGRSGPEYIRLWAQSQRSAMSRIEDMRLQADVHHAVDGDGGSRLAEYRVRYSGTPGPGVLDRQIEVFRFEGRPMRPQQAQPILRRLRMSVSPDLMPLIDGFPLPLQLVMRFLPDEALEREEFEGQDLLRVDFLPRRPGDGPPPNGFPGDGPPPDGRSGDGPPPGPPGERPPGARRPGMGGGPPPEPPMQASAWFHPNDGRLLAMRITTEFSRRRSTLVEIRFDRIRGFDVPTTLTINGAFTLPRRTRSMTILLDHQTRFANYEFDYRSANQ